MGRRGDQRRLAGRVRFDGQDRHHLDDKVVFDLVFEIHHVHHLDLDRDEHSTSDRRADRQADDRAGPGEHRFVMTIARDDVQAASWQALRTSVHLLTVGGDLSAATRVVNRLLDDVDRTYSRFRPDSELSRLTAASGRPVRVSPLLATAIEAALRAGRLSDGLVDPTVGLAMRLTGYDDD